MIAIGLLILFFIMLGMIVRRLGSVAANNRRIAKKLGADQVSDGFVDAVFRPRFPKPLTDEEVQEIVRRNHAARQ